MSTVKALLLRRRVGMKITCLVKVYERNGVETTITEDDNLVVRSHWLENKKVVIELSDGSKITVVADELERAIAATKRAHPF
jgi:DNA helicase TIP49 (TBP-interacting protein)